jgi:hypothetical protein
VMVDGGPVEQDERHVGTATARSQVFTGLDKHTSMVVTSMLVDPNRTTTWRHPNQDSTCPSR